MATFHDDKDEEELKGDENGFCSLSLTGMGRGGLYQHIYKCEDCQILVCEGCLGNHVEHEFEYLEMTEASCECGAGAGGRECNAIGPSMQRLADFGVGDEECKIEFISGFNEARDYDIPGPMGDASMQLHSIDYHSVEDIAKDCHTLAALSKETFWIDRHASPRCRLEAVAQQIMQYHLDVNQIGDEYKTVGAEYWCQVKDPISEDNIASGVDIHYDKDEFLSDKLEIGVFPAISTVTYLTAPAASAATIILGNKINDTVGEGIKGCLLSYPHIHKHVSFDGRFLHGAPAALNKPVFLHGSRGGPPEANDKAADDTNGIPDKRVTFLVNVWIRHRPLEAAYLSEDQVSVLNAAHDGGEDNEHEQEAWSDIVTLSPLEISESSTTLTVEESRCVPPGEDGEEGGSHAMIRIPFLGSEEEVAWGYEKKQDEGNDGADLIERKGEGEEEEEEEEEELSVFMWVPVAEISSRLQSHGSSRAGEAGVRDTTFFLTYETDKIAPTLA